MTAAATQLGWADTTGRTPSDRVAGACRVCGKAVCSHPDAVFAGVVVVDNVSDAGAWARHMRHMHPMREVRPVHDGPVTSEANR